MKTTHPTRQPPAVAPGEPLLVVEDLAVSYGGVVVSGGEDFEPLPGTRYEVEALARLFEADDRPTRTLLGAEASEPELERLAAAGELGRFGFLHPNWADPGKGREEPWHWEYAGT